MLDQTTEKGEKRRREKERNRERERERERERGVKSGDSRGERKRGKMCHQSASNRAGIARTLTSYR